MSWDKFQNLGQAKSRQSGYWFTVGDPGEDPLPHRGSAAIRRHPRRTGNRQYDVASEIRNQPLLLRRIQTERQTLTRIRTSPQGMRHGNKMEQ